jgi:hypothetical protein
MIKQKLKELLWDEYPKTADMENKVYIKENKYDKSRYDF